MPSITARQVCTTALRLLGVAAAEQPIEPDMAQTALDAFNALLDGWSVERLLIPRRPHLTLDLVAGQQTYTWGLVAGETTPADISSPAPVRLEMALLTIPGPPPEEWEIRILDQREYMTGIWQKTLQSSYAEFVYLDPTRPYATLYVWPVPEWPYQLQLFPWPSLPLYGHLDDAVDWPEGYLRAFQANLALDLAPQYAVEPSPTLARMAEHSRLALSPVHAQVGRLSLYPGSAPVVSGWARLQRGRP